MHLVGYFIRSRDCCCVESTCANMFEEFFTLAFFDISVSVLGARLAINRDKVAVKIQASNLRIVQDTLNSFNV
jgi:hypothetical protein